MQALHWTHWTHVERSRTEGTTHESGIKPVHLFFTPLKRPFKRTLSPHAAGCLLVALGPLGRARRMSKKDEDGDEHEHAKVGLRVLDEGTSKLSSQGVGRYRWSA